MPSYVPDLYEQVELIVSRMMRHYSAPLPARVVAVSAEQNKNSRADIQPLINMPFQDRSSLESSYVEAQQISDAPVLVPSSGASDSRIKLAVGDIGLWIPTMFSMDELLDTDNTSPVNPKNPKQQPYGSGFFIPLQWNRTLASASSADRIIAGAEVQIGDDPATAQSLAFKASVNSAFEAVWDEFLVVSTVTNYAGPVNPHPVANGTDHLKGT